MIRKVSLFAGLFVFCLASRSGAQTPPTKLDRQLSRIDLDASGIGQFNGTVSGPVLPANATNTGVVVSDQASNTLGALVTLRYVAKPYVGVEGNYTYARYTENYSTPPYGVQTQSDEFSIGYVATPPHPFFGLQPFVSVGIGTNEFKPTLRGGQGLEKQARALYYYSVGVQDELSPHFGLRAAFRESFFLVPDYGQNYVTIKQHTTTIEPTVGFYLRF